MITEQAESFQVTDRGFCDLYNGEYCEYTFENVLGIRLQADQVSLDSERPLIRERIEIRVEHEGDERFVSTSTEFSPDETKMQEAFRENLIDSFATEAYDKLVRGGELTGFGWRLQLTEFEDVESNTIVPIEDITGTGWNGDEFSIWKSGDEQPFASLAANAENTLVLERILGRFMPLSLSPNDAANNSLGRLKAEFYDSSPMTNEIMGGIAVIGFVAAYILYAIGMWPIALGVGALVIGVIASINYAMGKSHQISHYENGIRVRQRKTERSLLFRDIHSLTARWTDHYYNYSYTGTSLRLKIVPYDGCGDAVNYVTSAKKNTTKYEELEALQDDIARTIAVSMREELDVSGRVQWTDRLTILRDGFEFKKRFNSEPKFIAFRDISRWKCENGQMKFWEGGNWLATVTEKADIENFFPGLMLIQMLGAENHGNESDVDKETAASR